MTIPYSEKFLNELFKGRSKPVVIAKFGDKLLEDTQDSQGDWASNTAESQVDYDTVPGYLQLASANVSPITQNTGTTEYTNYPSTESYYFVQTFKQTSGASKILDTLTFWYRHHPSIGSSGSPNPQIKVQIFKGTFYEIGGGYYAVSALMDGAGDNSESYGPWNFNFSSQNIVIEDDTVYSIVFYWDPSGTSGEAMQFYYNSSNVYADGALYRYDFSSPGYPIITTLGDLRFIFTMDGTVYENNGSLTTQVVNLGETPTDDGEFKALDSTPSVYGVTAIEYHLYGSTDNFSTSNVDLGVVVDGDTISPYQYYKTAIALSSTSTIETPVVDSVSISFRNYTSFADQKIFGYEPSLLSISPLSTNIDDFDLTSVGQNTVVLKLTKALSYYLSYYKPKNNPAKILIGFDAPDWTENDYHLEYQGLIDEWPMRGREVYITIKDQNTLWSKPIPRDTSTAGTHASGTFSAISESASHPIQVMLTILQDHLLLRDSLIDFGSFAAVETALAGWQVTRSIDPGSGDSQERADELLNELRVLMGCYFIPQPNGKVTIKQFDEDEVTFLTLKDSDHDFVKLPTFDSNTRDLKNKCLVKYDWNTVTEAFDTWYIGLDTDSQTKFNEIIDFELEDYWTISDAQGDSQILAMILRILQRYANIPSILQVSVNLRHVGKQVGDQVWVSVPQGPSEDLQGIESKKYQIVNRNHRPSDRSIDLTLLEIFPTPGETWDLAFTPSANITDYYCGAHIGNGKVLFGSSAGYITRSNDFGESWSETQSMATTSDIRVIQSLEYGKVIAGTSNGLYMSRDFGLNFDYDLTNYYPNGIYSACYCGDGIVLIGGGGASLNGIVYRSTDYGETFDAGQLLGSELAVYSLIYIGNGIVLAGTGNGGKVYRSTDYGRSFTLAQDCGDRIHQFAYLGNGIVVLAQDNDGKTYKSEDYGLTWVDKGQLGTHGYIWSILNLGNGIVIAGTGDIAGHIYRSSDYGENYSDLGQIASESDIKALVYCGYGITLLGSNGTEYIYKSTG